MPFTVILVLGAVLSGKPGETLALVAARPLHTVALAVAGVLQQTAKLCLGLAVLAYIGW